MRDHARFMFIVGGAAVVVGGILVSIGLTQHQPGQSLWGAAPFLPGVMVVGLGVAIELVAIGLYIGSREAVTVDGERVTTTPRARRVILTMTPVQLTAAFRAGLTDVQAKRMTDQYLGRLWRVSGRLWNVHKSQGKMEVSLDRAEAGDLWVFLSFSARRWGRALEGMSPGESITVVGRIAEISASYVKVHRCRLVESPDASPRAPQSL